MVAPSSIRVSMVVEINRFAASTVKALRGNDWVTLDSLRHSLTGKEIVGLGGHDEIVPVEAFDFVGPPGHYDVAPLGQERRMMTLLFGQSADGVREPESIDEVRERKVPFQPLDLVLSDELPLRHLSMEFTAFLGCDGGGPSLTGLTLHFH